VKTLLPASRGYFAIGVEGISKAVNLGNLLRSAHAFGASFVFTLGADETAIEIRHDTSKAPFIIGGASPISDCRKAVAWSGWRF
jgi:hypothetical protein